ncbi:MAG: alkaline phosphatase family protein [Fibrobacteres bacterium]|nr:alkaline phosphatase family protein [Fibrobacterota bacterium]
MNSKLFFALGLGLACAHAHDRAEPVRHVLLISVDGMHALDLARFVAGHPGSALARLSSVGATYTEASSSKPSDSYPGLLAMVTGGSPISTGVYYDDSYDRNLCAPGSDCSVHGTEVVYDESVDINMDSLDAGGGIDPKALPLDPATKKPVYPHQFLRVNTVFEVVKAAGGRTAWSDKHPSYEIVNGPSGRGVDDLFAPEINSAAGFTSSVSLCETYDDIKVKAILNEIAGWDHAGKKRVGAPNLFGMNFQAVSVGQKVDGYADGAGTPSANLADALEHTDQSIGKMIDALRMHGLDRSTAIIISAKHGQSPIDPLRRQMVDSKIIPNLINAIQPGLVAQATEDDVGLIWLTDQSKTEAAAKALRDHQAMAGIQEVLSGDALKLMFPDPLKDNRAPDIAVVPVHGVIYGKLSATKLAEHGGFADNDTHVALLVAGPGIAPSGIKTPVQTTQIAPTLLRMLGLDGEALQAVRLEKTRALPGLGLRADGE